VHRDLGQAPDFKGDVRSVRTLTRMMQAGSPGAPIILLGHADGGLIAIAAVEEGAPAEGLILSSPDFASGHPLEGARAALVRVGLGRLPADWNRGWTRDGPDARGMGLTSDSLRGGVQKAWQTANPDLRMGGPSLGWLASFQTTSKAIEPGLATLETPTLLLRGDADSLVHPEVQARACQAMVRCRLYVFKGGRHALHLERDAIRTPWLAAVDSFVRTRAGSRPFLIQRPPDHGL